MSFKYFLEMTPELPALLESSQDIGIEVDTIIGDAAYSGKENLKLAGE